MSKAGNAIRRSGVILKSWGSSHSELQRLISQLKDARTQCKSYTASQQEVTRDMKKWAEQEENRAIKDTVGRVSEMLDLYTGLQVGLSDHLKEFVKQFEMILEGEKQIETAKNQLETAQEKETRCKKDLKKVSKRRSSSSVSGNSATVCAEVRECCEKLTQAEKEKDVAQIEMNERLRENEAVKMIRLKNGLVKWSLAHQELAAKSQIIFKATHDVAQLIPDAPTTTDIQHISYNGGAAALQITMVAKELLQLSTPTTTMTPSVSSASMYQPASQPQAPNLYPPVEQPPPYAEVQPPTNPYLYSHFTKRK